MSWSRTNDEPLLSSESSFFKQGIKTIRFHVFSAQPLDDFGAGATPSQSSFKRNRRKHPKNNVNKYSAWRRSDKKCGDWLVGNKLRSYVYLAKSRQHENLGYILGFIWSLQACHSYRTTCMHSISRAIRLFSGCSANCLARAATTRHKCFSNVLTARIQRKLRWSREQCPCDAAHAGWLTTAPVDRVVATSKNAR